MHLACRALLLAALVATAGCSGVFGGDPTTDTTTTERDPLAHGLSEDGLADANVLVNAHASSLDDESLTLRERRVQRYGNGTLRWEENRTIRAAPNRTRYLIVTDLVGRPMLGDDEGHAEVFADGDRLYRWVRTPNGSWTDVLRTASGDPESPGEVPVDPARTDDAYVLLSAFDANDSENVRRQTPDGGRYHVETSKLEHPGLLASHLELDEIRNATLEAVVTPDGLIEEYRIEYEGTHGGAVVRGETTVRYSAVGETTVEAPGWIDEIEDRNVTGDEDSKTASERTETTRNATEEGTTQAS